VNAIVRRCLAARPSNDDDVADTVQHVFDHLRADDCRVLKSYDPARATIATWLAVTAYSNVRRAVLVDAIGSPRGAPHHAEALSLDAQGGIELRAEVL
jgi:hypothetical protein